MAQLGSRISRRAHPKLRPKGGQGIFVSPQNPSNGLLSAENIALAVHPVPYLQTFPAAFLKNVEPFPVGPCLT